MSDSFLPQAAAEEITKGVEGLFGRRAPEDNGMWETFGQFAAQYDDLQILGITYLGFIASILKDDPLSGQITDFLTEYKSLCNNRNTLMAMTRIAETAALKDYFKGIEGKVNVQK